MPVKNTLDNNLLYVCNEEGCKTVRTVFLMYVLRSCIKERWLCLVWTSRALNTPLFYYQILPSVNIERVATGI